MIKKFISIQGTGKFLNYVPGVVPSALRSNEFRNLNLIYGENGSGKTTLAIILKSMQGDNSLLTKKRSIDRTIPQKIEILTDSSPTPIFTYTNNSWNQYYPEIEVFDVHFINENIYTGLEIETSHKKNLFEIIFGPQGVQLKNEIADIKDKIQKENRKLSNLKDKIELVIDRAYTAQDFCNVKTDPTIESKIQGKETEIISAKGFQEIQSKQPLNEITLLSSPIEIVSAIKILEKSINSISEAYLEKFQKHRDHLGMDGRAEQWIKEGFDIIADNKCPFCSQSLDAIDIIEAYKQYFNEEYIELLVQIAEYKKALTNFNIEATILNVENEIAANQILIDFWKSHILVISPGVAITENKKEWSEAFKSMQDAFTSKELNPISAKSTHSVTEFQNRIDSLNEKLKKFNLAIGVYNNSIASVKKSTTTNVAPLEIELKKLKAIKKRSEVTIDTLCTDYSNCALNIDRLNNDKDTKQQQLNTYSTTIFTNYSVKINQYLKAFAPYLEIRNLDSGYVGSSREPQIKYALHINGSEVKQGDDSTMPTFKYSLSEGDKSALALSFFLAKLEVEGNLQNKIILFDDPVSSFDLNRKSTTINKLIDFGGKVKQLFVLTHNLIFAGDFWKMATHTGISHHCSQITFIPNTSCLAEYDINVDTLTSVLKDSMMIRNYLTKGCLTDQERRSIARCLRPALESYFHLKFFDLILPNEWLGNFIEKVRNSTSADPFNRLTSSLQELDDINDYSKKYHHRFNNNADNEPVNDAELRNYCARTLNLIQII